MKVSTSKSTLVAFLVAVTSNPFVGASTDRSLHLGRRNQVSDACARESTVLVDQRALQDATGKIESECQPSSSSANIIYDYDECAASEEFLSACTSVGGKLLYYDVDISCSQSGKSVSMMAMNVPECVGQSCLDDGLSSKNEKIFGKIEDQMMDFGFICTINSGSSTTLPEPVAAPVAEPTQISAEQMPMPTNGDTTGDAGVQTEAPTEDATIFLDADDTSSAAMFAANILFIGFSTVLFSLVDF